MQVAESSYSGLEIKRFKSLGDKSGRVVNCYPPEFSSETDRKGKKGCLRQDGKRRQKVRLGWD